MLASGLVLSCHIKNTVGINVESDFNLGVTTGSHGDTGQLKIAKLLVVLGELALTLENSDADLGLVVSGGGESLGLLGGDSSVAVNKAGENATHGFNTEGKGSNIEQKNVLDVTSQDGALDSSTDSDGLIGVDTTVGLLAEEILNEGTNLGDTGGTTNHKDLIDFVLGNT